MGTKQLDRTTIAVRIPTRDRINRNAVEAEATVDEFINQVLDDYEKQKFWAAMEATSAEDYEAACREDGIWPGDYDYSLEAEHA